MSVSVVRPVLVVTAAAAMMAAAAPGGAVAAPPQPVIASANVVDGVRVLPTVVLPGLARATDHGPAAPASTMSVVVALARPDTAAEDTYLRGLSTPGAPSYRQFLTPQQVADRFGVPAATRGAVTAWLRAAGLTVDTVSASGDLVAAHGPVGALQQAFGVVEHSYTQGARDFVANTAAPRVPAQLPVTTVVGLNTFQRFVPTSAGSRTGSATSQDTCVQTVCTGDTTPADLYGVYDEPAVYPGTGQRVGVFGEGDTAETIKGLRQFEKANGLPQVPVTTLLPPGDTPPKDDPAGDGEWRIDVQASTGMAPSVQELRLYFGSDPNLSDADVLKMFTQWADDPLGPAQMDASFGECEALPGGLSPTLAPVNPPAVPLPVDIPVVGGSAVAGQGLGNTLQVAGDSVLKRAVLEGRTLFSSTGDTGSSCPVVFASGIGAGNGVANQVVPLTSYPASSPYVVGVGGTVLYTTKNSAPAARALEYPWTFGGGGDTLFIPQPDYQAGTPNLVLPCLSDSTGTAGQGAACRGIPDVSAQSGDIATNGYAVYDGAGTVGPGGGTSLSSPLWAGMWARVNGAAGGMTGFANPALYRVGKSPASYARDYFDVSPTDPASAPGGNGLYVSQPGWDYATGWGTPRVDGLICDIAGKPSGRFAAGVANACPLVPASVASGPPAAVTTTAPTSRPPATTTTKAVKAVKAARVARATKVKKRAITVQAAVQPTRTLAFTGATPLLPAGAVLTLAFGLGLGRRARRRRTR